MIVAVSYGPAAVRTLGRETGSIDPVSAPLPCDTDATSSVQAPGRRLRGRRKKAGRQARGRRRQRGSHVAIVTGFSNTARTDVRTAVVAPTFRSTSIGKDTTLITSTTRAKRKPTPLPTMISCLPAGVVRIWRANSSREAGTAPPIICAYITWAAPSHAKNITISTKPNLAMAPIDGDRRTSRACHAEASRPCSRRRLSSYRPTAANGPIRENPAMSGKTRGKISYPNESLNKMRPITG